MTRVSMIVLGIGLVILGIVGLGSIPTTPWLMWLDIVVGLVAFFGSFAITDTTPVTGRVGSATGAAVVCFALWIIGLATAAVNWQTWWTFAFACAFLLVALTGGATPKIESQTPDLQLRKRA